MQIKKSIEVEIQVTEKDLAKAFCDLDGDQQAVFFNEIAKLVKEEWTVPFEFQLEAVIQSKELIEEGRKVMQLIGEYSSPF